MMLQRYEFATTNDVGCGVASHYPTCLCDVDLARTDVQPIRFLPHQLANSALARDLCVKTDGKITFEGWASWLCTITDEAARMKTDALVEVIEGVRNGEGSLLSAYNTLLGAGYNTAQAAGILDTTPERLYEARIESWPDGPTARMGFDQFMLMELLIEEQDMTLFEITKELGLSDHHTVDNHAKRMNVTLPRAARRLNPHREDVVAIIDAHPEMSQRKLVVLIEEKTGVTISKEAVRRRRLATKRAPSE